MEIIGAVKLKIAIGYEGKGGCVVEAIELPDDRAKADVSEYGSWLEDLFYEGSEPPAAAGIYLFSGAARGCPWSDNMYRYCGEFERLDI